MRLMDLLKGVKFGKAGYPGLCVLDTEAQRRAIGSLAAQVMASPVRYVATGEVLDTAYDLLAEHMPLVSHALTGFTAPYRDIWVEAEPGSRGVPILVSTDRLGARLLNEFPEALCPAGVHGWYVGVDQSGRRGEITYAIGTDPEILSSMARDGDLSARAVIDKWIYAPLAVYDTVEFDLDAPGELLDKFWPKGGAGRLNVDIERQRSATEAFVRGDSAGIAPMGAEAAMAVSIMLLLSLSGTTTRMERDMRRENRILRAKGKSSLLPHAVVMHYVPHIGGPTLAGASPGGRDSLTRVEDALRREYPDRSAPRAHMVRGHHVTRLGKTFWRREHKRGDPSLGWVTTRALRHSQAAVEHLGGSAIG